MAFRNTRLIGTALFMAVVSHPALAGSCTVPGTHDSIQAAVDDPGCTQIELANRDYFELLSINRSVTLSGPPGGNARVVGQVQVTGPTTLALLSNFRVEGGCPDGVLRVTGGGQATADGIQVIVDAASGCDSNVFYRDGFETRL